MTMTPEEAAAKVVGKYSAILSAPEDMTPGVFVAYLFGINITPCEKCGAYRRADRCEVCEKVERMSV